MTCKHTFAVLLGLSLLIAASVSIQVKGQEQEQDQYSLGMQRTAWDHSNISILIVPSDGDSWWNPVYVNSTLRAINQWNDAITDFSANYSDFAYLERVKMIPTVSNETNPLFDIYIFWTEFSLSDTADEVGLSAAVIDHRRTILNSTINLAVKNQRGDAMREADMQNVVLHELGHGLGLRHSNYTDDLMYQAYTIGGGIRAISTLNVYAVAIGFQWLPDPDNFYPIPRWIPDSVTLPPEIEYQYLPISDENLPFQSILDPIIGFTIEFALRPEILISGVIVIEVGVVIVLLSRRKKAKSDG